jgi:hypothetical protein
MSLAEKTNSFCFKLFQITFKKATILISLDKKFAILQLKHFLLYLVFLKPKYELHLNQDCSFDHPNYSKNDSINFLIKKLKIKSKYFLQFSIQNSNDYVSLKKTVTKNINKVKDCFSHEVKTKPTFYNLNLSGLQLTNLLTKINLNSNLFQYLLKSLKTTKFEFIRQNYMVKKSKLTVDNHNKQLNNIKSNETKKNNKFLFLKTAPNSNKIKLVFSSNEVETKPTLYPLILSPHLQQKSRTMSLGGKYEPILPKFLTRKKNINYLVFNILFSGISIKLKHYILIKNANRFCLALNSFNSTKNIENVVKINLIFLNLTSLNLNSLPEFVWHANQIVILKDDWNLIYECLNIFKNFLYLQGFLVEFSEIKLGHTLVNYNKNVPGLNFLGFFIRQYKYSTKINFQLPNNLVGEKKMERFFYLKKKKNLELKTKWPFARVEMQHDQKSSYKFDIKDINNNLNSQVSISKPDIYKIERTLNFLTSTTTDKADLNNFNVNKLFYNLTQSQTLIINKQQTQFSNVLQLSDQCISTIVHPSKNEIKIHMHKLKHIIKNSASLSQENLILKLSTNIRLWSYYYHRISNKQILYYCDYLLFKMLWRWCCRRHPSKNKKWIKYKYFHQINGKKWIFGIYKNTSCHLIALPNHSDINLLKF